MPTPPRSELLQDPSVRWMMGGALISNLGDQFTLIALPWLVLTTTGDALKMGLIIALSSIPRALFILIGGAMVDRYSPKTVLMLTKHVNTVLLGLLAGLVYLGQASLPVIGALALGIGLASAFSVPSGTSMLPHVVKPQLLQQANGMMMGLRQLALLAGPLLTGLLLAVFGDAGAGAPGGARGLAFAFGFDCISFALSAWTLSRVKMLAAPAPQGAHAGVLAAVKAGMAAIWSDAALRALMLYWAVCAFVAGGIMQVALPVLAEARLHGGASLGLLLGANGAGMLLGMVLSGVLGKLRVRTLGTTLLLVDGLLGLTLGPIGLVNATWQAVMLMLPAGVLAGFMQVAVFSWIQQRVPRAMLGRAMSIFMFIFMGMAPLAAGVAGLLLKWVAVHELFAAGGVFLVLAALTGYLATPIRDVQDAPIAH
ncbi:MAG: MFS transporter [Gammaproteobacteria bacterium]